jgi:hypothetical protein
MVILVRTIVPEYQLVEVLGIVRLSKKNSLRTKIKGEKMVVDVAWYAHLGRVLTSLRTW